MPWIKFSAGGLVKSRAGALTYKEECPRPWGRTGVPIDGQLA